MAQIRRSGLSSSLRCYSSCSCNYTSLSFALAGRVSITTAPQRPAEVLDVPLVPQGPPSARTAKETKGNGGFRAVLVARYREMRAGRPLAGLRASAAAVRPLPSPHHSWALPDTPPSHPSQLHPHPLRLPASGAPAVSSDRRAKSENQDRSLQPPTIDLPNLADQ